MIRNWCTITATCTASLSSPIKRETSDYVAAFLSREEIPYRSGIGGYGIVASVTGEKTGQGGHGALPHELNDTVLAASQIVVAMQQLVSRRCNPFHPMVFSFGKFIANGATNVIPSEVTLAGSLRCMDEEERQRMLRLIPQIAADTAAAYGCRCETRLPEGYPCVISDEAVTREVRAAAVDWLGEQRVGEYPKRMTAAGLLAAIA